MPRPGRPVCPNRFKDSSATNRPDDAMKNHAAVIPRLDATKPVPAVAVGSARIPAPTVVPATNDAAPNVEPDACLASTLPSPTGVYSRELKTRGTSPDDNSGNANRSSSTTPTRESSGDLVGGSSVAVCNDPLLLFSCWCGSFSKSEATIGRKNVRRVVIVPLPIRKGTDEYAVVSLPTSVATAMATVVMLTIRLIVIAIVGEQYVWQQSLDWSDCDTVRECQCGWSGSLFQRYIEQSQQIDVASTKTTNGRNSFLTLSACFFFFSRFLFCRLAFSLFLFAFVAERDVACDFFRVGRGVLRLSCCSSHLLSSSSSDENRRRTCLRRVETRPAPRPTLPTLLYHFPTD